PWPASNQGAARAGAASEPERTTTTVKGARRMTRPLINERASRAAPRTPAKRARPPVPGRNAAGPGRSALGGGLGPPASGQERVRVAGLDADAHRRHGLLGVLHERLAGLGSAQQAALMARGRGPEGHVGGLGEVGRPREE